YAVSVKVPAHPGPISLPAHRLKVNDSTIGIRILKMEEPIASIGGVHPGPLVWPIDMCGALFQHCFFFIRAVYRLGPQNQLPTGGHPSSWGKNIVKPISLVEFGAFHGGVVVVAVKDHPAAVQDPGSLRVHPIEDQNALDPCPASRVGMDQIGL